MNTSTGQQVSSSAAATEPTAHTGSNAKWTLDTLPTEVLQEIWIHLDDPASWALTNKHLRSVSQDLVWRAKWFMQRFEGMDSIFEAMWRPKIWSPELNGKMGEMGADKFIFSTSYVTVPPHLGSASRASPGAASQHVTYLKLKPDSYLT